MYVVLKKYFLKNIWSNLGRDLSKVLVVVSASTTNNGMDIISSPYMQGVKHYFSIKACIQENNYVKYKGITDILSKNSLDYLQETIRT